MLTLTLIINLTKIIISKMGLLRVKVMNQHPLQLCSLLLALADHAYMLVYVPVTQLWSLSVPVVSHYCISTHAEFLNNPSKQYQNSKVSQQKLFFLLQHRSLSCWYPCNLLPYPIQLYPSCFPLQCVLQQPDEKWPGRGGWCEAANRDIADICTLTFRHTLYNQLCRAISLPCSYQTHTVR